MVEPVGGNFSFFYPFAYVVVLLIYANIKSERLKCYRDDSRIWKQLLEQLVEEEERDLRRYRSGQYPSNPVPYILLPSRV